MDRALVKSVGFVHLHVHSAYSLREGALTIETLAKLAKADEMPALAITDANNLFGALEFSEKLAKAGVSRSSARRSPSISATRRPRRADPRSRARARAARAARQGRAGLSRPDAARLAASGSTPTTATSRMCGFDALGEADGLIALTGGPAGPIDRALALGLSDLARARLKRLAALFDGRLYVELQRHGLDERTARRAGADRSRLRPCAAAGRRPTSPISPPPPITRRRTRCCASPKAR